MKKSEKLIRNSAINLAGFVVPLLFGLVAIPIIIKKLGVERFGILSLIWVVFSYFGVFDFGIARATTKYISEADALGDKKKITELFWTSSVLQLLISIIGAFAGYFFTPTIIRLLKIPSHLFSETVLTFQVLFIMLPVVLISSCLKSVLEAFQRFDLVNYIKIPANTLFFLIPAVVVQFNIGLFGITILLGLVRFLSIFFYFLMCLKIMPELKEKILFNVAVVKNMLAFGFWITISSVVGPIISYIERFFIVSMLSPTQLSYYSAPYEMVSRLTMLSVSIGITLFPAFSFENALNSDKLAELFIRSLKYLLILMTPIVIVLYLFAGDILKIWLGLTFAENGLIVFKVLTVTFFINGLAVIPFMAVQGLGRADIKAKFDIVASILFSIIVYFMIKFFGINGAAWSKLFVTFIDLVFLTGVSVFLIKFSPEIIGRFKILPVIIFSIFLAFTLPFLEMIKNEIFLIAAVVFMLIAYIFLVIKKGTSEDDKKIFNGVLRR
ncbi:MAG TPA: hypothetical protein DCX95_04825 [Elusimicrobia bacterium]|nr:hypothetical protein [Elusimicrobiota bacterium]